MEKWISCQTAKESSLHTHMDRLKEALDEMLHEEQAGFQKYKSCTDHIATLRIIIEQSTEWQSPLYINFTDFEKAFDSIDRYVI